ncbi:PAS domain-containing protein [Rhodovibrionaceae bacterium A322]
MYTDQQLNGLQSHSNQPISGSCQAKRLLTDPRMWALYSYWQCRRGLHLAPARQDVEPLLDLPRQTPHLIMIRLYPGAQEDQKAQFKLTVVGTQLVSIAGRDNTGRLVNATENNIVIDRFAPVLCAMRAKPQPHFGQGPANWINEDYVSFQHLLLPLCDRQDRLTHILGSLLFNH